MCAIYSMNQDNEKHKEIIVALKVCGFFGVAVAFQIGLLGICCIHNGELKIFYKFLGPNLSK